MSMTFVFYSILTNGFLTTLLTLLHPPGQEWMDALSYLDL